MSTHKKFIASVLLYFLIICTGCIKVIMHEEKDAAKTANKFANVAFIEKDYQKAYSFLSDNTKKTVTFEQLKQTLSAMHPSGFPTEVIATEYEPMPGQKGMSIFLKGQNDNEQFYYRFYMEGTMQMGYKIGGYFRGNRQYPPSQLRKPLR